MRTPATRSIVSAVLLLLASVAFAHRPHAVVSALVAPADYEVHGRAWLIFAPGDATQLLRTDDFGAHWSVVGGALQADTIVDLAARGGVLYALGADGTVWVSPDEGARWVPHEPTGVASTTFDIGGGGLAIATDDGAWIGDPTGSMTQAMAGVPLAELAWSASDDAVLLARTEEGGVARSTDGGLSFTTLAATGSLVTAIAEAGGVPFVGTPSGAQWWDGAAWQACGALPDRDDVLPGYVTELIARADGTLFATTATDAYFTSTDGCATWRYVETGLGASFGGIGGVSGPDQTYVALVVGDTHQLVAGFDGVASSQDGGATWRTAPVVSIDRTRGLGVPQSYPAEPRLFLGTYGGGIGWTDDGGRTFHGSNAGLYGPYNFSLLVDPRYATNRTVWWAGGQPDPVAVSVDDGATWTTLAIDGAAVRVSATAGLRYLTVVDTNGNGRLYRSADGVAWQHLTGLTEILDGAAPGIVRVRDTDAGQRIYVTTDQPSGLYVSDDGGATWAQLATWDEGSTAGLELWNARILQATVEGGLHRSDDDGGTWTTVTAPVPHPRAFAEADDGTLFLAGGDGQVWRSRDGGDSWEAAGAPTVGSPGSIVPADDFATRGLVFVGTAQGVYWSVDAGDTWAQLPRFQRFAMNGTRLTCTGACAAWDDGAGALDDAWDLGALDAVTFTFEGTALRVVADVLAGAPTWEVEVDGATVATDQAAEWLVSDLATGWHDVTLRVVGGEARLSAVEALAPGAPLPFWAPVDTGDTGDTADTDVDTDPGETGRPGETGDSGRDSGGEKQTPGPPSPGRCMCGTNRVSAAWVAFLVAPWVLRRRR